MTAYLRASVALLLVLGVITALAGLTFALQGLGFVGPAGSFMYRSSTWVTQGELVFVVGTILIIAAFALSRRPVRAQA